MLDLSRIDGFPVAENRIEIDRSTGLDCGSILTLDVDPVDPAAGTVCVSCWYNVLVLVISA